MTKFEIEYEVGGEKYHLGKVHYSADVLVCVAAEDAARDFYENYARTDTRWPIELRLFVNRKDKGIFKIAIEYVPEFYVSGNL